jgi:hypothetical protein
MEIRNRIEVLYLVSGQETLFSQKFRTMTKDKFEKLSLQIQYILPECDRWWYSLGFDFMIKTQEQV